MEKVMVAKSRQGIGSTVICGTRYGNVMTSRGSVIPLFLNLIMNNKELTITDPNMTRFMMTLEDAVGLVLYAFKNATSGDIFIQKAPAAQIGVLAQALSEIMGNKSYPIKIIGTRHGEKQHETLLTREEMSCADDLGKYYRIPPDLRDLNYAKFISSGEKKITKSVEYNSDNTTQLDVESLKKLLNKLTLIQNATKGEMVGIDE